MHRAFHVSGKQMTVKINHEKFRRHKLFYVFYEKILARNEPFLHKTSIIYGEQLARRYIQLFVK